MENNDMGKCRKRILLIQLGDLGDVILTESSVAALRKAYPEARIYMAVRQKAVALLEGFDGMDAYIGVYDQKKNIATIAQTQWQLFKKIRSWKIDTAINLRVDERGAYIAWISGATERFGKKGGRYFSRFYTNGLGEDEFLLPDLYMPRLLLNLLKPLGVDPLTSRIMPQLRILSGKNTKAVSFFEKKNIPYTEKMVIIHPMSLWKYKEWTMTGWQKIVQYLTENGFYVVLTGDTTDAKRCQELVDGVKNTCSIAGETTLDVLPPILSYARMVMGVDTMTIHMARAVTVPTATIFGPSLLRYWVPANDPMQLVILPEKECVPCGKKGCDENEKSECLNELSPQTVWEKLENWIVFQKLRVQ